MITESLKPFSQSYRNLHLYLNPKLQTAVVCLLTKTFETLLGLLPSTHLLDTVRRS